MCLAFKHWSGELFVLSIICGLYTVNVAMERHNEEKCSSQMQVMEGVQAIAEEAIVQEDSETQCCHSSAGKQEVLGEEESGKPGEGKELARKEKVIYIPQELVQSIVGSITGCVRHCCKEDIIIIQDIVKHWP